MASRIFLLLGRVRARRSRSRSWRRRPRRGAFRLGAFELTQLGEGVALVRRGFLDVADVEHRLGGEQAEHLEGLALGRLDLDEAGGLALAQQHKARLISSKSSLASLSPPLAFFSMGRMRFSRLSRSASISSVSMVSMSASGSILPSTWVMSRILEAAHDMGDGVAFADIGEELVAEALALRGAAHEAGDIDEGEARRDDLLGARDLAQHVQPRIRHRDIADIRLDGAERIIGGLRRRRLRQRVEQGRFADIRQPDDTAFEAHRITFRSVLKSGKRLFSEVR